MSHPAIPVTVPRLPPTRPAEGQHTMTADAYLVLRCDGPDETEPDGRCGSEGTWPVRHAPYTHRELRRLLKEHRGWRRTRDGRDICPEHAATP